MAPEYFPLRWESTRDQWWYASPIDWAAANGLYNVVKELLHLDTNLLIKLSSLRRIRRFETVWDDEAQFDDVAKCRAQVAHKLLLDCETRTGTNSLIRAGYGGWLVYTAASAGDVDFVKELLDRDPLLVFGEGEYGVTDMLYAASRSKSSDVFRLLLDFTLSPGSAGRGEADRGEGGDDSAFKLEMMNRAVHAAARGGNVEILRELLEECSDVLMYRDLQGSSLLHSASGRGQVGVVKYLISTFNIINERDNQGDTALHVAAYRGYFNVVEVLIHSSPSLVSMENNHGDTFLHLAVAGFRTPGFRRLDRQTELIKQLVSGKIIDMYDVVNIRNKDGSTALHVAVLENIQTELVELLMTVRYIDLNMRDNNNMTPLDLLRQRPRSASSDILIKQLISAGGISNCQDNETRSVLLSHLKEGLGGSPGTSFRISDAEIFLYSGIENTPDYRYDSPSIEHSRCLSDISDFQSGSSLGEYKTSGSKNKASSLLKFLFSWPGRRKDGKPSRSKSIGDVNDSLVLSSESDGSRNLGSSPIPLRQQYAMQSSLPNIKRVLSYQNSFPSPCTREKFTTELMHGVIQPRSHFISADSRLSSRSVSGPLVSSSTTPAGKGKDGIRQSYSGNLRMNRKQISLDRKLMNQYLCFGAQNLGIDSKQ
ncbi:hypothetical protein SAY87_016854 [Trapa incisa]|uniref:Ankyrin repeat-containing protein n=1 Tax=Trapa incisa TaxID=236973 RepID=A0AAN7L1Z4_9MYRT|nr:hypothetical protein SAY87_016854 [Trapa incisa]